MGEETICGGEGMRGQVADNEGMRGRFVGDAGTACSDQVRVKIKVSAKRQGFHNSDYIDVASKT